MLYVQFANPVSGLLATPMLGPSTGPAFPIWDAPLTQVRIENYLKLEKTTHRQHGLQETHPLAWFFIYESVWVGHF